MHRGLSACMLIAGISGILLVVSAPAASAAEPGAISGRVTSASTKTPIEGAEPCAAKVPVSSLPGTCAVTNANGEYTIGSLAAGEYIVTFISHESQYDGQYYNHKSDYSEAEPVLVVAGHTTVGVDGELPVVGGSFASELQGHVTDVSTKAPIEGIEVCAYEYKGGSELNPEAEYCATTNTSGEYAIGGLAPGEYIVEFADPLEGDLNYVRSYYSGAVTFAEAERIYLPASTTEYDIDGELSVGGLIEGHITNASSGGSAANVLVCATLLNSEVGECAVTSASGAYTIAALATGEYAVEFLGEPSYLMQYFDATYVASEARLVPVVAEQTTAGIDAALYPGVFQAPVALVPPSVSGSATVGGRLSCSSGSWNSNPPPSFAYVWLRDGTPIPSATQSDYVVQSADVGSSLTCEVEATDRSVDQNGLARALSSPVAVPVPSPSAPPAANTRRTSNSSVRPVLALQAGGLRMSRGGVVRVRVRCENAECRGSLELIVPTAARCGVKRERRCTLVIARTQFALGAAQSATVSLRLSRAADRRLAYAQADHVSADLIGRVRGGKIVTASVRVHE